MAKKISKNPTPQQKSTKAKTTSQSKAKKKQAGNSVAPSQKKELHAAPPLPRESRNDDDHIYFSDSSQGYDSFFMPGEC